MRSPVPHALSIRWIARLVSLLVRLAGVRPTQRILACSTRLYRTPSHAEARSEIAGEVQRLVWSATEGMRGVACLERSLTLWWCLARLGIATEITVGVRLRG